MAPPLIYRQLDSIALDVVNQLKMALAELKMTTQTVSG